MRTYLFKVPTLAAVAFSFLTSNAAYALQPIPAGRAYGIINRNGEIVVPPACDLTMFSRSGDWVSLERGGKQGFLNLKTRQSTGLIFDASHFLSFQEPLFSQGLEPALKEGKYGYVDQAGAAIIPFRYDLASEFAKNGLAAVRIDGKFGYIDRRGELVIPPRFDRAWEFDASGLSIVQYDGFWGAIDQHGQFVIPAKFDRLSLPHRGDLAIVSLNGLMGAVDRSGRIAVPIKFGAIRAFGPNGLAAASLDAAPSRMGLTASEGGHWGFIDRSGEFVIPPVYTRVSDFEDERSRKETPWWAFQAPLGLAEAESVDATGVESTSYIDPRGRAVISLPTGIKGVRVNRNDLITVFDERKPGDMTMFHKWGIFDPAKPAIPTTWFDSVGSFGDNDLAPVELNFLWGYVDRSGTIVIAPQFRRASEFTADGLAPIQAKDPASSRYSAAFIDRTGQIRLQTPFDDVSSFGDSGFAQIVVERARASSPIALPADQCAARARLAPRNSSAEGGRSH